MTDQEWKEKQRKEIQRKKQLPIQTDTILAEVPLQQVPLPDCVTTGTLKNGLTYYIVYNDKILRQADFYLVQRTGSLVEEDGQEGVAHLVEHMLFCGTKHFSKQQLMDYFRRIGMDFGDELNAETSFHETVYKLRNVPMYSPHSADSSLLLLRDWAGDALFPTDMLEKERTVVMEEYRNKQSDPYHGKYYEYMYPNSLYVKRFPIGKEEVIKYVSAKELKAFYHKWYQPQHQAVIVVGDVDKESIEAKIKALFSDLKRGKTEIPDFSVKLEKQAKPRVCIHPAKGRSNVRISLNYHCPRENDREYLNSVRGYVDVEINSAIIKKWEKRMARLRRDHPQITSTDGEFKNLLVQGDMPLVYGAYMADYQWQEGLTFMVQEHEKIRRYGWKLMEANGYPNFKWGDGSFPEIKDWNYECSVNDNSTNDKIVQKLRQHFVYGVRVGLEGNDILMNKVLSHMNPAQAYQRLKRMENDSLLTIIMDVPDSPNFHIPTADEVLDVVTKAQEADLYESRYQYALDTDIRETLDSIQVDVTPGKILSATRLPFPNSTVMELSNGITLMHIESSFFGMQLEGFRPGGLLQFSGNDYWQAKYFSGAERLPYQSHDDFYGNISYSDKEDNFKFGNGVDLGAIEQFYKMCYLTLANTEIDSAKLAQNVASNIKWLERQPKMSLYQYSRLDSLVVIDPFPSQSWTMDKYESISYDRVQELFRQYKSNYNGTVMVLATSSNSKLKDHTPYIEKYIASLPSLPEPVHLPDCPGLRWKDEDLSLTDYTREDSLRAGCTLMYNQNEDYQYSAENRVYLQALRHILNQLLENKLRLEQGNIYSVNNYFGAYLYPYQHQKLEVSFTCSPQHIRQFIATTDSVVNAMAHSDLLTQQLLDGFINATEKYATTKRKENSGLSQHLLFLYRCNELPIKNDYDWSIVESLTVEKLRAFAAQLLDKGHRYEYVTMPKGMEPK